MFFSRLAQSPPCGGTWDQDYVWGLESTRRSLLCVTFHILQDHAEVAARLEGAEHGHHEGVLRKGQDVPLHEGLLDLVPQDQVLAVDLLHGEALAGLLVPDQVHGSVKAPRNLRFKGHLTVRSDLLLVVSVT